MHAGVVDSAHSGFQRDVLGMGLSARGYIGGWKLLKPSPDNFRGPSDYLSGPYIGAAFGYAW